jgi:molybdopterin converting factor small subunit|tara:strand:+ start:2768 stop:3046 length:279 start_codon:yes stop_codon:yes gene_type:complete
VSVTVAFPALFAERIGGVEAVELELEGETVGAALRALTDRHGELAPLVWRPEHELNPVMAVFLNGRQLRPEELTTPTRSGDQIQILSALEGG